MATDVRPAAPADRPLLLALFRAAFGAEASAEEWAWKYERNPNPGVSAVAVTDGRVVGFYGAFGTRYRGAGGDFPGVSAVDVMTDPAARRLGRQALIRDLGEAYCRLNREAGAPFYFGFPHERHRVLGERLLGYRSVEPAGEWTRPLGATSLVRRLGTRLRTVRVSPGLSGGHDSLAETLHARSGWRTDRSRATLDWRFGRPGSSYLVRELRGPRGASRGYAAVRVVGDRALLLDLQVADEASGAVFDLLDGVAAALRGTGAARLALRAARSSRLAQRLEAEGGFVPAAADCHFEVRLLDEAFDLDGASRVFDYRYLDHDIF
jgi:predicted N-acetyltransferase YhbS